MQLIKNHYLLKSLLFCAIVFAFTSCGEGSSGGSSSSDSGQAPSAPVNIQAAPGDGQATLTWDPAAQRADYSASKDSGVSYNVYMAAEPGVTQDNYRSLSEGMTAPDVTSPHMCTHLTNGTAYYIVLTAENEYGESAESEEVSVTAQAGL